jgi:hypothetical protein
VFHAYFIGRRASTSRLLSKSAMAISAIGAPHLFESLEPRCLMAAGPDLTAQYQWNPVDIGAGGFVTGFVTSPQDANVRFARTEDGVHPTVYGHAMLGAAIAVETQKILAK